MKYLQRYLSLLFALVMSLSLFSIASAEENVDTEKLHVYSLSNFYVGNDLLYTSPALGLLPGDIDLYQAYEVEDFAYPEDAYTEVVFSVANDANSTIFSSGYNFELTLDNLSFYFEYSDDEGNKFASMFPNDAYYSLVYADGTTSEKRLATFNINRSKETVKFECNTTPEKDVIKVNFYTYFSFTDDPGWEFIDRKSTIFFYWFWGVNDEYSLDLTAEKATKSEQLQEESNSWLGKIFSGISKLFDAITDLPDRIWASMEDGLIGLIVPSEEAMAAYKDKWDELLSSRLGAVYEVTTILTDSWGEVMSAGETGTISFPSVTINLPGDASFTFGGYDVDIVPDGFEFLQTAIKSIVGIVCTVLFINGLRSKYDEVMGVEK